MKTLAQIGFEAFVNAKSGDVRCSAWAKLTRLERQAWESVANAILEARAEERKQETALFCWPEV